MRSTPIRIQNNSGQRALIQLYHVSSTTTDLDGNLQEVFLDSAGYLVENGAYAGPLEARFLWGPGDLSDVDDWYVRLVIFDTTPGVWTGRTTLQLRHGDAKKTQTFTVDRSHFSVQIGSRNSTVKMTKNESIKHPRSSQVFVLMLENHSFDNIFAKSGISGITVATDQSNQYNGQNYPVTGGAPSSMPTDPGHEFMDVVEQLCGSQSVYTPDKAYPAINNSGFASNYATTTTEGPPPDAADIGDIMACFDTKTALPVIYKLATEFALCDHWFSSLPGPTWPNRYFVHGASSNGMCDSPSHGLMEQSETYHGFALPKGSIYDLLSRHGLRWRIFNDEYGPASGRIPQVTSLKNLLWPTDTTPVDQLARELQHPYDAEYTFIEPSYGDLWDGKYSGGSSQHPTDSMSQGERLIKQVYEAIRSSPLWYSSLLIVIYDEHGGFYDSVKPPTAHDPGDGGKSSQYNTHGFEFTQYGVRVPAVIVSPWIAAGTISTTTYDHASVLKTVEKICDLPHLTKRDDAAKDLTPLVDSSGMTSPRTDCPMTLPDPPLAPPQAPPSDEAREALARKPLPERGNIWGVLANALKTEIALSDATVEEQAAMMARVKSLKTWGEANAYLERVVGMVESGRRRPG